MGYGVSVEFLHSFASSWCENSCSTWSAYRRELTRQSYSEAILVNSHTHLHLSVVEELCFILIFHLLESVHLGWTWCLKPPILVT
jgi:hypothetical protein